MNDTNKPNLLLQAQDDDQKQKSSSGGTSDTSSKQMVECYSAGLDDMNKSTKTRGEMIIGLLIWME